MFFPSVSLLVFVLGTKLNQWMQEFNLRNNSNSLFETAKCDRQTGNRRTDEGHTWQALHIPPP